MHHQLRKSRQLAQLQSIFVKISTPMDIRVTPVELGGKFLIKPQMISATLTLSHALSFCCPLYTPKIFQTYAFQFPPFRDAQFMLLTLTISEDFIFWATLLADTFPTL
nr:hypothetical protein Iba_chr13dCG8810 [Ipomoea batatas]